MNGYWYKTPPRPSVIVLKLSWSTLASKTSSKKSANAGTIGVTSTDSSRNSRA